MHRPPRLDRQETSRLNVWWRRFQAGPLKRHPLAAYQKSPSADFTGFGYIDFLALLHQTLRPQTYFEIGTAAGDSLSVARCRAVCVDPQFRMPTSGGTPERVFMPMTSDAFFARPDVAEHFPHRIDLAFLDGMHRFEFLYRDLMHTERFSSARSLVLLHDCLPLNARMAERKFRHGDETELLPGAWTGDVWKLLPALKKYRPDLDIVYLDCPPTGLVAIGGLNNASDALQSNYARAIAEFGDLDFAQERDSLFAAFPMLDSRKLAAEPASLNRLFGG